MIRFTFFTGITALFIIMLVGCGGGNGDTTPPADEISSETLYEVRMGNFKLDPKDPNLIPLSKANTIQFQFLKKFDTRTFNESLEVFLNLVNVTSGWSYNFSLTDLANNGALDFVNNEWGSVVTYTSFFPFDTINIPYYDSMLGNVLALLQASLPGDKIIVNVVYIRAEFDDGSEMLLKGDDLVLYYTGDVIERPAITDNVDTEGVIQGIKFGEYPITDDRINIIPLDQVYEISLDFNTQLNPYKFKDLLDFRVVVNNVFKGQSYIIERANMEENGDLKIIDYVRGYVSFRMDHPMTELHQNGIVFYPADPGDLLEIRIDYFAGEDIFEQEFLFQNRKFRVFYAGD